MLLSLPSEILEEIVFLVGRSDGRALQALERSCRSLRALMLDSGIYRRLCQSKLVSNPQLESTFVRFEFSRHQADVTFCRRFWLSAARLERRWRREVEPRVSIIDCIEARSESGVHVKDVFKNISMGAVRRRLLPIHDVSMHPSCQLLVVSIHDVLLVFELRVHETRCLTVFTSDHLDDEQAGNTTCFAAGPHYLLICGTQKGRLRLFHMITASPIATVGENGGNNAVNDLRVIKDIVLDVDSLGVIRRWRVREDGSLELLQILQPPFNACEQVREAYCKEQFDRKVDFNQHVIVVACWDYIYVLDYDITRTCDTSRREFFLAANYGFMIPTSLKDDCVFWAEEGGVIAHAQLPSTPKRLEYKKMGEEFSLTSALKLLPKSIIVTICALSNFLLICDTAGLVTCLPYELLSKSAEEVERISATLELNRLPDYDFTMADEARIFWVDNYGYLMIHDYWPH